MFDIHSTTAPAFSVAVEGDEFRFSGLNSECLAQSDARIERQLGKTPHECFAKPMADFLLAKYRECTAARLPLTYEVESILPIGYTCWRTMLIPIVSRTDDIVALVGFCTDITTEKMAERAQNAFHEKVSLAFGAIDGGFWIHDVATGDFETSKPLAELLAGPGQTSLNLAEYVNFIHAEDLHGGFAASTTDDRTCRQYRVVTWDGSTRWLESNRRIIRDAKGEIVRVIGLVLDITDHQKTLRTLEKEAATDGLTGLKNRRAFERFAASRFEPGSEAEPLALVLIDLDGFKPINDRFGHRTGDDILRGVARRIGRAVREYDMLARLGGDEFAILIEHTGHEELAELERRLERAFARPFRQGDHRVVLGASIGVALRCAADRSIADLMDRADQALYAVKRARYLKSA